MRSLRGRLVLGTTIAVAAVLALSGSTLYALVEHNLVGQLDRALAAKAGLLASLVEQSGSELDLEFQELDMSELAATERGEFLQLWRSGGETLYRSPSLGDAWLELRPPAPAAEWLELPTKNRGRAFSLRFEPRQEIEVPGIGAEELVLVLAKDSRDVDRALATLKGLLVVVGLVTLLVAGVVLHWVVRRSLVPLGAVSERIASIGGDDLSTRLQVQVVPGELRPIVERVNGLLARLESAFARERAFSNEVAHELRTPLAALRTTLEVTGAKPRSEAEYAEAVRGSATIVSDLQSMTERLLQLARLDAGRPSNGSERYDLADLVLETWESFAAPAASRGLRVDLHLADGFAVSADRELLALILRNLYDNAVTYANTGGQIRVSTRRAGDRLVSLEVSNSGSRLSQEETAAATRRFWRGDSARTEAGLHCGLGLALADKATRALEARLELRSQLGGEFTAAISLPTCPADR